MRNLAVALAACITLSAFGSQRVLIDQYCTNCHNEDDKVAGLKLDVLSLDRIPEALQLHTRDHVDITWLFKSMGSGDTPSRRGM